MGDGGHMVVLHPRQVPHQPGDRVRTWLDTEVHLIFGQPFNGSVDGFAHPPKGVKENIAARRDNRSVTAYLREQVRTVPSRSTVTNICSLQILTSACPVGLGQKR